MQENNKSLVVYVCLVFAVLIGMQFNLRASEKVDFSKDIQPILDSKCIGCHGPPKKDKRGRLRSAKAGLRLDSLAKLMIGSRTGPIVVPGKPDESLFVELISLPSDDEDRMPPKKDPLSEKEVNLIRSWIEQLGAKDGTLEPAINPLPKEAGLDKRKKIQLLRDLGDGLKDLKYASLVPSFAQVRPVYPGSPLLRVSFVANEDQVNDEALKFISKLSTHIAILDLGKTKISNKSSSLFKKLPKLVKIDLHSTELNEQFFKAVSWPEVRSINLSQSKVGDGLLAYATSFVKLQELYVWKTKVSESGVAALRGALPNVKLRAKLVLPSPAPKREGNGRRRR